MPDLVSTYEITQRHGVSRLKIFRLAARGLWPDPLAKLKVGNIYDGTQVARAVQDLRASGQLDGP